MTTIDETVTKPVNQRRTRLQRGQLLSHAAAWVDERLPLVKPVNALLTYPVSQQVQKNILYTLGGLTFTSFMLQIISGILMLFYYAPSLDSAYASVDYITYQLPLGWLIRGIHVYNASAIFIFLFLHLVRTFLAGAYKKPHEITWLSGVLLLLITVGFAFTGALLPWDQKGYWATVVGTEIAGSTPIVGEWLMRLMRGGTVLGQTSLTRFFVVHTLLMPMSLLAIMGLHLSQLRHGAAAALTPRGNRRARQFVPFFPNRVLIHVLSGLLLLTVLIYLSWNQRAPLEFMADPTSTSYTPRPEWYFLSLFQLLNLVPGRWELIATQVVPGLVIGSLFLLPFVDRSEERRPWRRPIAMIIALIYILAIIILTLTALPAPV